MREANNCPLHLAVMLWLVIGSCCTWRRANSIQFGKSLVEQGEGHLSDHCSIGDAVLTSPCSGPVLYSYACE
jgi:hypothetical protein